MLLEGDRGKCCQVGHALAEPLGKEVDAAADDESGDDLADDLVLADETLGILLYDLEVIVDESNDAQHAR